MEVLSFGLKRCPHCCQKFVWRFFSHFVSLGLRIWCGRRQSSFSSLTTVQVSLNLFVMTETTWASFRTLSMCFPLNTLSHFALHGELSFLFDSWWLILFPQRRFGLWSFEFASSDQYEVLQMSSIVNNLSVHWFERFLDRTTTSRRSEAEFFNFDLYNHSRIISESISRADNWTWSHLASKS